MRYIIFILLFVTSNSIAQPVGMMPLVMVTPVASGGIITANRVEDWDATSGITIATGVSHWVGTLAGYDLVQATTANQPSFTGAGATSQLNFDGSNDFIKVNSFPLTQPYTVYMVMGYVTWTSLDYIVSGSISDDRGAILQYSSTPSFTLYDGGGTLALNGNLALNTLNVEAMVFNNTNSSTKVNTTTTVSFAAGAGVGGMSFLILGSNNLNTGACNMFIRRLIYYNVAHTAAEQTQNISALKTIYSIP